VNIQDVNHAIQTAFFAGATILTDNVFEIIGAIGVILNLAFVYQSYSERKKLNRIESENKALEKKILIKQLEALDVVQVRNSQMAEV